MLACNADLSESYNNVLNECCYANFNPFTAHQGYYSYVYSDFMNFIRKNDYFNEFNFTNCYNHFSFIMEYHQELTVVILKLNIPL